MLAMLLTPEPAWFCVTVPLDENPIPDTATTELVTVEFSIVELPENE